MVNVSAPKTVKIYVTSQLGFTLRLEQVSIFKNKNLHNICSLFCPTIRLSCCSQPLLRSPMYSLLIEVDPVVVHAAGVTATSGMLPVFACGHEAHRTA